MESSQSTDPFVLQFFQLFTFTASTVGRSENPKVGKVKMDKQIVYHVTAPMSEQFSESRSDRLPYPFYRKGFQFHKTKAKAFHRKEPQFHETKADLTSRHTTELN